MLVAAHPCDEPRPSSGWPWSRWDSPSPSRPPPTPSPAIPTVINPDSPDAALQGCVPVDDPGVWLPGDELAPAEADEGCDAGNINQFVRADGTNTILSWTHCHSEQLARRWQAFLEKVTTWPMFSGLISPTMPTGVQIATYSSANGWRGYGARRRWDWSYAASTLTPIDAGDLGRE